MLPKYSKINTIVINLEKSKQLFYKSIYSLDPIELETQKTFIKTHLANNFICLFKLLTDSSILFDQKYDKNL